jgi:hypothetical protein
VPDDTVGWLQQHDRKGLVEMKNFRFTPFEAVLTVIVFLLLSLLAILMYPVITFLLGL